APLHRVHEHARQREREAHRKARGGDAKVRPDCAQLDPQPRARDLRSARNRKRPLQSFLCRSRRSREACQ
ncbi:unnamed protein product, partial [Ascophyllum nodosum]